MDIDLLFTGEGEAGLIANGNFVKKAIGVVLDNKSGILTLEYADSDYMEFNIPVESDFFAALDANAHIHVGAIKNGNIAQAYQVPLMFFVAAYPGEMLGPGRAAASRRARACSRGTRPSGRCPARAARLLRPCRRR